MFLRTLATCFCGLALLASPDTYGRPLKLTEETRISELLAKPIHYQGKEVRVRGTILQVCASRGCMMMLKGDERFQKIQVKVEDGIIRFPADGAGREAVVEGILEVKNYSEAEVKKLCATQRKALFGKGADMPGPKHFVRIKGLGAEIHR